MESAGLPDSETKRIAIDNSTIAERHVVIAISCGYQPTTTWMILYRYEIIAINSSYRLVGGSIHGAGAGIIAINNRYAPSYVFSRETHLPTDVFPREVHPNSPLSVSSMLLRIKRFEKQGHRMFPFQSLIHSLFRDQWLGAIFLSFFSLISLSFPPSIEQRIINIFQFVEIRIDLMTLWENTISRWN